MSPEGMCAGRSLKEIIEAELDVVLERLLNDWQRNPADLNLEGQTVLAWGEERGAAQGLAYALAVITNPYYVNVEEIKNEAMLRYEARMEEAEA